VLFKKLDGGGLPPEQGDRITPLNVVVNIRADYLRLDKAETQLGTPIGFARPGETFILIDPPVEIPLDGDLSDWGAWWAKVRRVTEP
jgi:hypothetical protein